MPVPERGKWRSTRSSINCWDPVVPRLPLDPGASVSVSFKVTAPLLPPACALQNVASVIAADGRVLSSASATGFAPVTRGCDPPVKINKALDPSHPCIVNAVNTTLTCGFTVTITNMSDGPIPDPGFQDIMPPGSTLQFTSAPLHSPSVCAGPKSDGGPVVINCWDSVAPVPSLKRYGDSVSVSLTVAAPLVTPLCQLRNDVRINDIHGAAYSHASAIGHAPAGTRGCTPPGAQANLKIDKAPDPLQPCAADVAKQAITCGFIVTITNRGPAAYTDAVAFHDVMPTGSTWQLGDPRARSPSINQFISR
jgi:uncharacterized repeat protein (TIGR01451 family)